MALMEEQERIKYQHKLEIWRVILDKLILGAILVSVGFAANMLIEKYKAKSTEEKFFLERRLDAVEKIREKYSEITTQFYGLTELSIENAPLPKGHATNYKNAITQLSKLINNKSILLGNHFLENSRYIINIHAGLLAKGFKKCNPEYRLFIPKISDHFTSICRSEVNPVKFNQTQGFSFKKMTEEEMDNIGAIEFFNIQFKAWKELKEREKRVDR